MQKLKSLLERFRTWFLRKKALRGLRKSNRYAIEVEKIMEQFATQRILSGQSPEAVGNSRQVLMKHQQTIQVKSDFQAFLDNL
jgi:hypothetical protein